jgi:hypothetical protein
VIKVTSIEQWSKVAEKAGDSLVFVVLTKVSDRLVSSGNPSHCHLRPCLALCTPTPRDSMLQPPEGGMLRATVQPLARQPAWSHVVFAEVDTKQMPVRPCLGNIDQLIVGNAAQGDFDATPITVACRSFSRLCLRQLTRSSLATGEAARWRCVLLRITARQLSAQHCSHTSFAVSCP